ncbi:MAG: VOC family protein [Chloroflexi bacterium]|nr:VOC family protein [Chloroflexota bacterium]
MFKWIDHVIIAVNSLEQAIPTYEKLGLKLDRRAKMASQGVNQAFFNLGSGHYLELVEPLGAETPVGRFLSRRGEGLYLIALAVADVSEAMKTFEGQGIRTIPVEPEAGAPFVHPGSTHGVLIQLIERR